MVTLSNGKELTPDMNKITIREYRSMFLEDAPQDNEDTLIARVFGLGIEELQTLGYADYRLLLKCFFDAAKDPVSADPKN